MTYKDLDQKAKAIAGRYKACEHELLQIIIEVDKRKAFLHLGYNSFFHMSSKAWVYPHRWLTILSQWLESLTKSHS